MVVDKLSFVVGSVFSVVIGGVFYLILAYNSNSMEQSSSPSANDSSLVAEHQLECQNYTSRSNAKLDSQATLIEPDTNQVIGFRELETILDSELNNHELVLLGDPETIPNLNELRHKPHLLSQVIHAIASLNNSPKRDYLLSVLLNSDDPQKEQAAFYLLSSTRTEDQSSAISLILSMRNIESKAVALEHLMAHQINRDATKHLLQHLRNAEDLQANEQVKQVIQDLFVNSNDSEIKAMALQAIRPMQQLDSSMFNELFSVIDSGNATSSFQGLEALNGWLYNNSNLLDSDQLSEVRERANMIAEDRNQSIETRMKALELLANIQ